MDWLADTIQEDAEVSVGPQQPLIERAGLTGRLRGRAGHVSLQVVGKG